jgi:hypothetical protein
MNTSRWLKWQPKERISRELAWSEPTKPTEPGFDGFVGTVSQETSEISPLEETLKGRAMELYLAGGDRVFIVADEADAAKLGEPRGTIYTAAEVHRIVQVADPNVVAEVHRWKRQFNATVGDLQCRRGDRPVTVRTKFPDRCRECQAQKPKLNRP